ncbi:MAG: PSD1 and planctomycete cytochrome C domain-containing protein [Planctomycetota bacterium]
MIVRCVTLVLASVALTAAAESDESDRRTLGEAFFEKNIRPVFAQRCQSCHSEKSGKREGGLVVDSRESLLKGGDQGPAIIPGDIDQSLLLRAVRHNDPNLLMPPTERLNDETIGLLETWIRMGAPFPSVSSKPTVVNPSDPEEGKAHWAFQPLAEGNIPQSSNTTWARNDIDRFVLGRLEAEKLIPVPDADDVALVRRLTFQLVGLPPTSAQLRKFESLPRYQAVTELVEELLASPQFGQRWGRHWLDLARYADSNGLDENFLFREAWRYRNWVIDAVNADLPFDRFLLEQIAGDLLPYESIEQRDRQRIASGFLEVGPKVLLGVDPNRQKMDIADEQLETIGRTVLGQTIGCARCHDHKFDPIPTADYYALAGIFTSTTVMEQRFMLNEQRVMERLVGLGENGPQLDDDYEKYYRELSSLKLHFEKAKATLELLKSGTDEAIAAKLASDADGFADVAKDANQPRDMRTASQEAYLKTFEDALANPPKIPPRAMIPCDSDAPADEHIRLAGKFDARGDQVSRGFLRVLSDGLPTSLPENQSGRIQLSQWLTNPSTRTGALTARVLANRIWHHMIGRGLVRTVDNFGRTGEVPSHPELLDYLAGELIRHKWSVKSLIRQIALSRTFGLAASFDSRNHDIDPDNILLWRAHRRRLDPESLRDAMLTAAGTLDLRPMDSTVDYLGDQATAVGSNPVRRRTDYNCRSVYLPVIRNDLPELFEAFDFANVHQTTGARPKTTVPTQGLFMLNDTMVMAAADTTAGRVITELPDSPLEERIERMFQITLSRGASAEERRLVGGWFRSAEDRLQTGGDAESYLKALSLACHAVFASSHFQYLE